jgi:acetyl-CoA carboxylase biotin carboxyl carrier protein
MAKDRGTMAGILAPRRWTPAEIVELAVAHDLAELEVEAGGMRVRVVRRHAEAAARPSAAAPPPALTQPAQAVAAEPAAGTITVEAPMVGTFYRASSPDAPPFVNEGDTIKEGQTLCVIEAMKLMNEIDAKLGGRIVKVLVDNAQPVQFGQALFLLEPLK